MHVPKKLLAALSYMVCIGSKFGLSSFSCDNGGCGYRACHKRQTDLPGS